MDTPVSRLRTIALFLLALAALMLPLLQEWLAALPVWAATP